MTKTKQVPRMPAKVSPLEKAVINAPHLNLINEFKNIQRKESKLPLKLRKVVALRIENLVSSGFILSEKDLHLCSHPFFNFKSCDLIVDVECSSCQFVNSDFL